MLEDRFRSLGSTRRYGPGDCLFLQGDPPDTVFLLQSGRVKVTVVDTEGRESVLAYRGLGDVLGELGPIDGAPRSAAAVATEPTSVVVLPADAFMELVRTTPGAALDVLAAVAGRLRDADRQRAEFGGDPLTRRLARRLAELADDHGRSTPAGTRLDVRQKDLAGMLGTTRETVTRALATFRAAGAVETGREHIVITDPERLRALGA